MTNCTLLLKLNPNWLNRISVIESKSIISTPNIFIFQNVKKISTPFEKGWDFKDYGWS